MSYESSDNDDMTVHDKDSHREVHTCSNIVNGFMNHFQSISLAVLLAIRLL